MKKLLIYIILIIACIGVYVGLCFAYIPNVAERTFEQKRDSLEMSIKRQIKEAWNNDNAFLYFTEGDQIQDPGKLRYSYKLQNSMKQKCGEYNIEINLYEFMDIPVDKDNFSAVLYVRYSNEKGTFLLIYYPEKVWTGKASEDTYRYDQINSIHQKDLEILRKVIDKLN